MMPVEPIVNPRRGSARRMGRLYWMLAILVAIAVHGTAFVVFGVRPGVRESPPPANDGVVWVGERADQGIELRDPKPIFLPTKRNAAVRGIVTGESRGPGEIFPLEPPRLTVPMGESPPGLVVMPEGVQTAGAALRRFSRPYFSAFGQVDEVPRLLRARVAMIEVQDATSGAVVHRMEVPMSAATAAETWPFWAPFEVLLAVESTGTLGPPLVPTPGSGAEVVDEFFRSSLRALLQPNLLLPAGYYRVEIGP